MTEQKQQAQTIVVHRMIPGEEQLEENVIPVSAILRANRDATDSFTYLRVVFLGRRYNWHVTETPSEINAMANKVFDSAEG